MKENSIDKQQILSWVDDHLDSFFEYAKAIWSYAELSGEEYKSSSLFIRVLKENGFDVEENVAGMPTAFIGRWGSGKPVIGFSCEYDALPGLSQQVLDINAEPEKKPVVEDAPGHGCGHCLLGTGAIMAAVAVKEWLSKEGKDGTLIVYGTPGEELCVGKSFMAREGLYENVDAIIDWHPWNYNNAGYDRMNAYFNIKYHFRGWTAHGNAPWNGRSALDSALLMAHALEMLREHMPPGITTPEKAAGANTMNYTFSDCGPEYPNVVPDRATLWVIGRFVNSDQMRGVIERIHKCAEGAAIATGTKWEMEFVTATHEKIPNKVLATVLYDNWQEIGTPQFSEAEQNYARALQRQMNVPETGIDTEIIPFEEGDCVVCDTSEYSWFTPFTTIWVNMLPAGFGWHNWQVAGTACSPIGKKSMVTAVKILATSCVDLVKNPEILGDAKKELEERLAGRAYKSLIPDDVTPPITINKKTMEKYRPLMEKHYKDL